VGARDRKAEGRRSRASGPELVCGSMLFVLVLLLVCLCFVFPQEIYALVIVA
jgi:hypothetical protein